MQDTKQTKMLSIDELNEVLLKLQNKENISIIGTFSEVDIVFIAGLFLWYKQHEQGWKKIPTFFDLSEKNKIWDHSHYFKLIDELYGIKHNQIFENFPTYTLQKESYSRFFAPPIYITKDNLDYFFGERTNKNFDKVKNNYITKFQISDFIKKTSKNFKDYVDKFNKYEDEIKNRLNKYPPIFTFIFIVASKNLAKAENEIFDKRKDYIEKLFLFTQDYVNGLYELAKNIVEHSGHESHSGEGMITIRAYLKSSTNNTRILETHVFDYGKNGVIPKLIEYTKKNATRNNIKNQRIKDCYTADNSFFTEHSNYQLKDFIDPDRGKELKQQSFRHTSHYGITKLHKLIKTTLNSEIFIASKGKNERDYFGENAEYLTIKNGTHFYFRIPFNQEKFKNIVPKQFSKDSLTATLGETASLEFLSKIKILSLNLSQLSDISTTIENSLINITIVDENITKINVDNIYNSLDKLLEIKDNNKIAINLQDKINDVSVLLRFLSYLTFEYKQPFIIYNLNYKLYNEFLADNKDFHESRQSEAYWHNEKAMLLFVKTDKDFYFSDILFGKKREEFLFVNNIVSKTFPNTITILQELDNKKNGIKTNYQENLSSNQNLQQFFYPKSNNLLPFDALLKNKKDGNPLFISNLTTILKNPLFNRDNSYTNLNEYIDNFDGFRIINTHFKIGTKIHSEDFYYAKRLFQNSFYTARLAMLLAIKIKEKIGNTNQEITLVGYELYSELLLSLIEKFLKDLGFNGEKINHFITQSDEDDFKFLPIDTFKKYLDNYNNYLTIIIVPIAATGSTASKIENDIKAKIYKKEKNKFGNDVKKVVDAYNIFELQYNIILSQPVNGFETIKKSSKKQTAIINIPAKWHNLKDCPLCYGTDGDVDVNGNSKSIKTKTLFETDKSCLTPALIFGKPKGKIKAKVGEEVENIIVFDNLNFDESIKYKKVFRNNNYRIYYIESDMFIEKNLPLIKYWLNTIVKSRLNLSPTDKVVIVAPCHESNSRFLNLVNEIVFSSSATIIHYQNNEDFTENFKLLNKNYLSKETKLFYVDDSLITGKHFYEVFDLVKDVSQVSMPFTATIFLKDKSEPFTHNKIVEISNIFFVFTNLNQPTALNLLEQRPLEHERQRYESLSKTALHDVTIGFFQNKADGLNPTKLNRIKEEKGERDKVKELRRIKSFEATHKIYDYFAKKSEFDDYDIDKIVDFKDYSSNSKINLFSAYSQEVETQKKTEREDNLKALLKVLSQYPFILYQPLREKTFEWLKVWLCEIEKPNENCFEQADYDNFKNFKFLLRRASLLGNYEVVKEDFLQKILTWFIKIDKYFAESKLYLSEDYERNLSDFPIYILRNYVEMIQKNGWIAYHILKNIEGLKSSLLKSKQGSQFFRMLQIESALVIDDFYQMITKEKRFEWRDIFKNDIDFIEETDKIVSFFVDNQILLESNKYLIIKETFLNGTDEWIKLNTPFVNYLWIKQLLFVDCIDKDSHFPKNIDYQRKIDVIIEKMKEFFLQNKVRTFFVVTDGQQKPHILKEEHNLLDIFNEEFDLDKQIKDLRLETSQLEILKIESEKKKELTTQILIDFLNGIESDTRIGSETTAEYYRSKSEKEILEDFEKNIEIENPIGVAKNLFSNISPDFGFAKWTDAYNKNILELPFMPKDSKWLYLIRITKQNEHKTNKFDTLGLLGFYSTENLYNSSESLLPKQLLMLLRRDMGRFVEKHHKNDEFAGLIQQKEKADYQFLMKHGVRDYTKAINNNLTKITEEHKEEYLKILFEYLVNKFNIISKLSTQTKEYENITFQKIIEEFKKYNFVFTFYSAGKASYSLDEVDKLIDFTSHTDLKYDSLYKFPKDYLSDLVFELLYNIRSHIIISNKEDITEKNKLHIIVYVKNNILYIENNHCTATPTPYNDKSHGLNLLEKIWRSYGLGKTTYDKTDNDTFKVTIPLIIIK